MHVSGVARGQRLHREHCVGPVPQCEREGGAPAMGAHLATRAQCAAAVDERQSGPLAAAGDDLQEARIVDQDSDAGGSPVLAFSGRRNCGDGGLHFGVQCPEVVAAAGLGLRLHLHSHRRRPFGGKPRGLAGASHAVDEGEGAAALYVLHEAASGYAVFEAGGLDEVGRDSDAVQGAVADLARFGRVVRLAAFRPFASAADALDQCNAISEGLLTTELESFLELNLPKVSKAAAGGGSAKKAPKFSLGVAEPKLGSAIQEATGIPCQSNDFILELVRGIRLHFARFIKDLKEGDLEKAQLGLGHSYSRSKVKFNVNRVDNMIIQSISLLDTLDKDINTFCMRVREWYSWHFPELVKIVNDNYQYAQCAGLIKDKSKLAEDTLPALTEIIGDPDKAQEVLEAARASMGQDISPIDMINIENFAQRVVKLVDFRRDVYAYLVSKMADVAPNLGALIGEVVGARLISHAGSLTNLAKYPASTVQILGAEKALFRALKTKGNTPKYGLIFHSSFIGRASARNKGRISRYLANKCSIACRIDCFSETSTKSFGEKLKEQVEERLNFYDNGVAPRRNIDVMKGVIDGLKQTAATTSAEKPKQKEKRRLEDGMPDGVASAEKEPTPKSKKKEKKSHAAASPGAELLATPAVAATPASATPSGKSLKKAKKVCLSPFSSLFRVGIPVVVLERSPGLREGGAALSLWGNAWRALDVLGVGESLRSQYTTLTRVELCSSDGRLLKAFDFDECDGGPHEVRGVHRVALLQALAKDLPPNTIRFSSRVSSIAGSSRDHIYKVGLEDGDEYNAKVIVGCDGANSKVAKYLGLKDVNYAGYSAYRGVSHMPAGHSLGGTVCQALGRGVRAGMYPLNAQEVYWFTVFNSPPGVRDETPAAMKKAALDSILGWPQEIVDPMRCTSEEQITRSDITDRWLLPLPGVRWGRGGVTLAGDAAHPMTPNLGQGACTALEDSVVLARELADTPLVSVPVKQAAGEMVAAGGSSNSWETGGQASGKRQPTEAHDKVHVGTTVDAALERYEKERLRRCAILTVRANAMGRLLQLPYAPRPGGGGGGGGNSALAVGRASALKERGNVALARGDTAKAIEYYTRALELVPRSHILYSNRSAAYFKLGQFQEAVLDAEWTIEIAPYYEKGYSRLGAALYALGRYQESARAYRRGADLQPGNEVCEQGWRDADRMFRGLQNRLNPNSLASAASILTTDSSSARKPGSGPAAGPSVVSTAEKPEKPEKHDKVRSMIKAISFQFPPSKNQAESTKPYFTLPASS
eukprot:SM000007S20988  [mRNA]  locus=s7:1407747:1419040:+ [translate_table: standard]